MSEQVTTPVVEETQEQPILKEPGYIQKKKEQAKKEVITSLLTELGATDVDDIKNKVTQFDMLKSEVNELKQSLQTQQLKLENQKKKDILKTALDNEKCFDSEILLNLVELDKVKIENNIIKDMSEIISGLKQTKPNFFGNQYIKSDVFIENTTQTTQKVDYNGLYEQKDYANIWKNILNDKFKGKL